MVFQATRPEEVLESMWWMGGWGSEKRSTLGFSLKDGHVDVWIQSQT